MHSFVPQILRCVKVNTFVPNGFKTIGELSFVANMICLMLVVHRAISRRATGT
jgi:hypothetical protein